MSLIFIGPKRVYVLLLFWQSIVNPYCLLGRPLAQIDCALGDVLPGEDEDACRSACHLVMAVYNVPRKLDRSLR